MGHRKSRIPQYGRTVVSQRELPPLEVELDLTPPREISSQRKRVTDTRGVWDDSAIRGNPPGPKKGTDAGTLSGRAPQPCNVPARTSDTRMF